MLLVRVALMPVGHEPDRRHDAVLDAVVPFSPALGSAHISEIAHLELLELGLHLVLGDLPERHLVLENQVLGSAGVAGREAAVANSGRNGVTGTGRKARGKSAR
jgi:hypothetical protein